MGVPLDHPSGRCAHVRRAGDAFEPVLPHSSAEDEMKLGLYLRNMGPQSTRPLLAAAARAAEAAGIDDLWVADHLALAPEDSEGSNGRYLEPLATLAFLAGITERVGLGVGVLIVPYRPALLTAKWIATIQELSGERMILGVGVGWMDKEFRALGVDPRRRGAITDATLAFLHACFAADEVEANGQRFLFRPRPARPPVLVGGAPPHAIRRAVRFGDGWMPTGMHAEVLDAGIASLREGMAAAGKPAPEVVLLQSLPVDDDQALASRVRELAARGVTRVVHPWRYEDADEVARVAARLVAARDAKPSHD
jgi:probable F420-dependent oxidoreductase